MMGVAAVAWLTGVPLNIWVLPWQGETLTPVLFFSGLAGAGITLMAIRRIIPVLFILWALIVAGMTIYGFFFGSYVFGPMSTSFNTAVLFAVAALLAAAGSVTVLRARQKKTWATWA